MFTISAQVRPQPSHVDNPFWNKVKSPISPEMIEATEAVRNKVMGFNQAAASFGFHKGSFHRTLKEQGIVSKYKQGRQQLPDSPAMAAAIESVRKGEKKAYTASQVYGVPYTTLRRRLADAGVVRKPE
ncbi:hypothetical protein Fcan01_01762 [Folsomia candida]|uniref:HTH psq-type domain-containing protein n=1 Tax=Folsomia candida TaxID=158441 RepID=A0A226EX39_FOLCA|nr:hypothetical protein Fcan01_01762 [Folsomia candida]